jgi:hypothetical protein
MSENPVLIKTSELRWLTDFAEAQRCVWRVVRQSPLIILLLVAASALPEINSFQPLTWFLNIVLYVSVLSLSVRMVYETWADLTGEPRQDPKRDLDKVSNAFGNGIIYGLFYTIGLILLVAPGIYVMVAGSLGIVFVVLEGIKPMPAFRASEQLIKGSWKQSARYLMPPALLFGGVAALICIGISFVVEMSMGVTPGQDPTLQEVTPLSRVIFFVFGLWLAWMQVSQMGLLVRLYRHLKTIKSDTSAPG